MEDLSQLSQPTFELGKLHLYFKTKNMELHPHSNRSTLFTVWIKITIKPLTPYWEQNVTAVAGADRGAHAPRMCVTDKHFSTKVVVYLGTDPGGWGVLGDRRPPHVCGWRR